MLDLACVFMFVIIRNFVAGTCSHKGNCVHRNVSVDIRFSGTVS